MLVVRDYNKVLYSIEDKDKDLFLDHMTNLDADLR